MSAVSNSSASAGSSSSAAAVVAASTASSSSAAAGSPANVIQQQAELIQRLIAENQALKAKYQPFLEQQKNYQKDDAPVKKTQPAEESAGDDVVYVKMLINAKTVTINGISLSKGTVQTLIKKLNEKEGIPLSTCAKSFIYKGKHLLEGISLSNLGIKNKDDTIIFFASRVS